jgi:hypothetical protein
VHAGNISGDSLPQHVLSEGNDAAHPRARRRRDRRLEPLVGT